MALAQPDIRFSARQVRRYLGRLGAGWRRTTHSLRPKPDPVQIARAVGGLGHLNKKRPPAA